jgi:hypothetical protein
MLTKEFVTKFKQKRHFTLVFYFILALLFFTVFFLGYAGRLNLGGDDSRLYLVYPWTWIENVGLRTIYYDGAFSQYSQQFFIIPYLLFIAFLKLFIPNAYLLQTVIFTLALLGSFIAFQRLLAHLTGSTNTNQFIAAGAYTCSPILLQFLFPDPLQYLFLPVYIPLIILTFLKYLKNPHSILLLAAIVWSTLFSVILHGIPWILPMLVVILATLILSASNFSKSTILAFLKKSIIFTSIIAVSQSFWIYPLVQQLQSSNSRLSGILSLENDNQFEKSINSNSSHLNIFFPLLNLPHFGLQNKFNWPLYNFFVDYYQFSAAISLIYIFLLLTLVSSKNKTKLEKIVIIALLISLALYTANIYLIKNLYIIAGSIPGFIMFRNFFDKFAFTFVFFWAGAVYFSLQRIKSNRFKGIIGTTVLVAILLQAVPFISGQMLKLPSRSLDTTFYQRGLQNIEVIRKDLEQLDSESVGTVLSLPFTNASYDIIAENNKVSYIGISPIPVFTSKKSIAGKMSIPAEIFERFELAIIFQQETQLQQLLNFLNVTHLIKYKNIPPEFYQTSYFSSSLGLAEQEWLLSTSIVNCNQELTSLSICTLKNQQNELFYSPTIPHPRSADFFNNADFDSDFLLQTNIKFNTSDLVHAEIEDTKISPEEYSLQIELPSQNDSLIVMKDIFREGWKVYHKDTLVNLKTFPVNKFHTGILLEYSEIADYLDSENKVWLSLRFQPHQNFFIGSIISILTLLSFTITVVYEKLHAKA